MSKYLLEIGTEEIPYRFMEDALNQMKNNMEKILDENRISYENVYTYGTPRRLVVLVEGINRLQEDLKEMVKGPSKRIAYNDSMEPSKALLGFARGQGVDIENIIIKE